MLAALLFNCGICFILWFEMYRFLPIAPPAGVTCNNPKIAVSSAAHLCPENSFARIFQVFSFLWRFHDCLIFGVRGSAGHGFSCRQDSCCLSLASWTSSQAWHETPMAVFVRRTGFLLQMQQSLFAFIELKVEDSLVFQLWKRPWMLLPKPMDFLPRSQCRK